MLYSIRVASTWGQLSFRPVNQPALKAHERQA